MKLSEVIKAIEDGSESKFVNNHVSKLISFKSDVKCEIILYSENKKLLIEKDVNVDIDFPLYGWEEVKPPRQWSEKELMLFKLLPDWAKWISKDDSTGNVFVWEDKPLKMTLYKEFNTNEKPGTKLKYLSDLFYFLTITFEESPIYIGDLKGE